MKNGEVYEFETLLIARQQVEEMTGQDCDACAI